MTTIPTDLEMIAQEKAELRERLMLAHEILGELNYYECRKCWTLSKKSECRVNDFDELLCPNCRKPAMQEVK